MRGAVGRACVPHFRNVILGDCTLLHCDRKSAQSLVWATPLDYQLALHLGIEINDWAEPPESMRSGMISRKGKPPRLE